MDSRTDSKSETPLERAQREDREADTFGNRPWEFRDAD